MAEKRKFSSSICVKVNAKTTAKIELFPAEQWAKTAQEITAFAGRFRLRINRRWHDLPEGAMALLDSQQIGILVASLAAGGHLTEPPAAPDLPRGTSVRIPTRKLAGVQQYEISRTHTEPMRGHDGRFYVNVVLFKEGSIMVPVDTLRRYSKDK